MCNIYKKNIRKKLNSTEQYMIVDTYAAVRAHNT